MPKPSFLLLWNAYPKIASPCDGPWANQCAIRMSLALNGEATLSVNSGTYSEPRCAHGHARGAESLAHWLTRKMGVPAIYKDGAKAKVTLMSSTGVVFFKDCFTRGGETVRVGDHIDLWNKGLTKTYDDPANKASQVWFWSL